MKTCNDCMRCFIDIGGNKRCTAYSSFKNAEECYYYKKSYNVDGED